MRVENTNSSTRVFLTEDELQKYIDHYQQNPFQQLAIRLMGKCGLRVGEVVDCKVNDIVEEDGLTLIKIREAKKGHRRETIIYKDTLEQYRTLSNLSENQFIFNVTKRTVQNWVKYASESIARETGEEDYLKVSPHDLRRSWASALLQNGFRESEVMDFGGWEDYETFKNHYWKADRNKLKNKVDNL